MILALASLALTLAGLRTLLMPTNATLARSTTTLARK